MPGRLAVPADAVAEAARRLAAVLRELPAQTRQRVDRWRVSLF